METEIIFKEERSDYLLSLFDKEVNDKGYIVDVDSGNRVTSTSGDYLQKDDLGYVGHNSIHFVEDDISALVGYLDEQSE